VRLDLECLVGRRFEHAGGAPDWTFTGAGRLPGSIRVHVADGSRGDVPLAAALEGVASGALVESERGVPFVHEREASQKAGRRSGEASSLRTGIAGSRKALLRLVPGSGRFERF
jgi:hypothetical protein